MLKAIQKVEQVAFMHQAELESQGAVEPVVASAAVGLQCGLRGEFVLHAGDAQFALGFAELFRPVETFFVAQYAAGLQALQQLAALLDVEFVAAELAQACFAAQFGFVGPVALDLGLPGVAMGRPGQRTGDAAEQQQKQECFSCLGFCTSFGNRGRQPASGLTFSCL